MTFEQFIDNVDKCYYENEFEMRHGQVIMNVLCKLCPEKYNKIKNTNLDCFYDDGTVRFTLDYLEKEWDNDI